MPFPNLNRAFVFAYFVRGFSEQSRRPKRVRLVTNAKQIVRGYFRRLVGVWATKRNTSLHLHVSEAPVNARFFDSGLQERLLAALQTFARTQRGGGMKLHAKFICERALWAVLLKRGLWQ